VRCDCGQGGSCCCPPPALCSSYRSSSFGMGGAIHPDVAGQGRERGGVGGALPHLLVDHSFWGVGCKKLSTVGMSSHRSGKSRTPLLPWHCTCGCPSSFHDILHIRYCWDGEWCASLTISIEEEWSSGPAAPPAHPDCRPWSRVSQQCSSGLVHPPQTHHQGKATATTVQNILTSLSLGLVRVDIPSATCRCICWTNWPSCRCV